jgi:hypothetical protein
VSDAFEFDPAAADRAVARLTVVLDLMDQRQAQVEELQHVTRPGAAPPTQAFHVLLGRSMARLREQHEEFRRQVETRIEELRQARNTYTAMDREHALDLGRLG